MSYIVQKKYFNSYRCTCCYRDWEVTDLVDTFEEAVAQVPLENEGGSEWDVVLEEVEVKDGATGNIIAWGILTWPRFGRGRSRGYYGYKATRWYGNNGAQNFDSAGNKEEWEKILQAIEREVKEKELQQAEQQAEQAQGDIERIRARLTELSPEAKEDRKPPPPAELVGALHDKVHKNAGKGLAVSKLVKAKVTGVVKL